MYKKVYSAVLLLMFACVMTFGISVAKFSITQSSGTYKINTACFAVYTAPTTKNRRAAIDSEYLYNFTVSNYKESVVSEVLMTYDVVVAMPEGFPVLQQLNIILDCNGEEKSSVLSEEAGKLKYTFANAGIFYPLQQQTHDCTLFFIVDEDYDRKIDIKGLRVYVVARQID